MSRHISSRSIRRGSWLVGLLSLGVLILTADYQIYDNNFYTLSEATAILAGEHPFRDFFEWGVPLQAYLSAAAQWLSGGRLIGEFALQWGFITAGVVLSFHLAVRLSRSANVALAAMLPAVLLLAASPTYQYTKVFIYPCAALVACRYIERPSIRRSAALGAVVAIAFLFRHDHGIYVGLTFAVAFVLAWRARPGVSHLRARAGHLAACAGVAFVLVLPWLVTVARSEGLLEYIEARSYIKTAWSVQRPVFSPVLAINPLRALTPDPTVAADAEPYERLLAAWLPARGHAAEWLYQMTILVAIAAAATGVLSLLRQRKGEAAPPESEYLLLTGGLMLLVAWELFREQSYFVMTTALAAACGARFLRGPEPASRGLARWLTRGRRTFATLLLLITLATTVGYARESNLPHLIYLAEHQPHTWARLTVYPPIDGLITREEAAAVTPTQWQALDTGRRSDVMLRYVFECVATGDHVLVSGPTPYQIGYYVQRPVAGGHVYWHDGWRSDPVREAQSLALIQRQSVPFAFSTDSAMLDDLKRYPRIHDHVAARYRPIPGTGERVLIDAHRPAVRQFGEMQLPCFR
jgi:hypothetical protein